MIMDLHVLMHNVQYYEMYHGIILDLHCSDVIGLI